jgi:hypothetical protein
VEVFGQGINAKAPRGVDTNLRLSFYLHGSIRGAGIADNCLKLFEFLRLIAFR